MDAIQKFYRQLTEQEDSQPKPSKHDKPLALVVDAWTHREDFWWIFSRLLDERFLLVSNEAVARSFADRSEVIYTFDEVRELMKLPTEGRDKRLKTYHLAKKELDGTVTEVQPRTKTQKDSR